MTKDEKKALLKQWKAKQEKKYRIESYSKYAPMLRAEFLSDILMGAVRDEATFLDKFDLLHVSIPPQECAFAVVNVQFDQYEDYLCKKWNYGKDRFNEGMKNFLELKNNSMFYLFYVVIDNSSIKMIGILPKSTREAVEKTLKSELEEMACYAEENLKLELKFSIADIFLSYGELLSSEKKTQNIEEKQMQLLKIIFTH